MALKDMRGKLTDATEGPEGVAMGKVYEWLDEYKKAAVIMETFGFTVKKFSIDMSRQFWGHVELKLAGVTLDVTLGLVPSIDVHLDDANV